MSFIGTAATLRVWDNSVSTDDGAPSTATEIFSVAGGKALLPERGRTGDIPAWARPLLAQALKLGLPRHKPR